MNQRAMPTWTPAVQPVHLRGAARVAGLRVADAWHCLRTACAPFRDGTRFQALPDVRFWCDGARQRATGMRLPGPDDRAMSQYRDRLRDAGSSSFALRVDEPLLADAPLWDAARVLLRDALGEGHVPVLPVSAALTLRSGVEDPPWTWPAGHARLIAVLEGALCLDGGVGDVVAGDAVWWPVGSPVPQDDGALLLVLSIAVDPATIRVASREAAEAMLLRLLERQHPDDGKVAMLPFPPQVDAARGVATMPALHALARALAVAPLHATLAAAAALDAALRASGLGLEPRPIVERVPLRDDTRVRLCPQGIVRQRLDETRWLLAVNGHALIAEDRVDWRRLWSRLCKGEAQRVDVLVGGGRGAAALREWLEALQTLGGLQQDEAK